jgi:sirohydrochlorin cobaltochelatase
MLKHCIFVMTLVVLFASEAVAAQNIDSVKKGILLVAFGTSAPGAERAIDNLVSETKAAFPGIEVRLAYTSNIIRRKLRRERNLEIPTPPEALAQMNDERFTHVYVQPMHVIPGEEYDDLKSAVNAFASVKGKYGFERIALGRPFLADSSDCELMAEILARRFAAKPEDSAIVLMGHGSSHEGNSMYVEMQKALSSKAKNIFLGTVEEGPGAERLAFDGVLAAL